MDVASVARPASAIIKSADPCTSVWARCGRITVTVSGLPVVVCLAIWRAFEQLHKCLREAREKTGSEGISRRLYLRQEYHFAEMHFAGTRYHP